MGGWPNGSFLPIIRSLRKFLDWNTGQNPFKTLFVTISVMVGTICKEDRPPTAYFLGKICLAHHLEPSIPEERLVTKLVYHYEEGIPSARLYGQIKTTQAMITLLENCEHENYYRHNRYRDNIPNREQWININRNNESNINNNNSQDNRTRINHIWYLNPGSNNRSYYRGRRSLDNSNKYANVRCAYNGYESSYSHNRMRRNRSCEDGRRNNRHNITSDHRDD